jgi:photosystem II protein
MNIFIYWNDKYKEVNLPFISLTKSKMGETGTATFIFINPSLFQIDSMTDFTLQNMSICLDRKNFSTQDIEILFWEGKPYLVKSIFLFKNSKEWFEFLTVLGDLSKETGLAFFQSII